MTASAVLAASGGLSMMIHNIIAVAVATGRRRPGTCLAVIVTIALGCVILAGRFALVGVPGAG